MAIVITGIGSDVPPSRLTNKDFEKMGLKTSDSWIVSHTGIKTRPIAGPDQASSDLMVPAAQKALENANLAISDIDLIIATSSFPDRIVELTSDIIATKLSAPANLLAVDVNAECAGFCWALADAVEKMTYDWHFQRALVVSGDATTRFVDYQDRETCVLFGDGAGAVVLENRADEANGIIGWRRESDRRYQDCLRVEAGGTAMPANLETVEKRRHYMHFGPKGGSPMLRAIVSRMPDLCLELCQGYGIDIRSIKRIIPHQLNKRITDAAKERLMKMGVKEEVIFDANTARYGNCSGSSVPMALDTVYRQGDLEPGDLVLLIAFGAGLKYGAVLLRWWLPKFQGGKEM